MALKQIDLISVPVTDVDRARDFYVQQLGFRVDSDYVMGPEEGAPTEGLRWVMLTPPAGGAKITLVTWFEELRPGSCRCAIGCDDADAAYAELTGRGVEPASAVADAPWGRWFGVDDPDGNNWLIVQPPA
jgi:catechol 2,3-dioxygenase-like lactoylglutathione lyase family enzyme